MRYTLNKEHIRISNCMGGNNRKDGQTGRDQHATSAS